MDDIGRKIMLARKSKNLTQSELAEILNRSKSTISNWEIEGEKLSIEKLQKIADALDVDVSFFTVFKNEKNQSTILQSISLLNKSIIYNKFIYKFSWFKNILLFTFVVMSICSVLLESINFFILSLLPILLYTILFIISRFIDVKQTGPTIYYSNTSVLVLKHDINYKEFKDRQKGLRSSIVFQLFLILLGFFFLIGMTATSWTESEAIYMVGSLLVLITWSLYFYVDLFKNDYIESEINYFKIKFHFGIDRFEFNLLLSILFYFSCMILLVKYKPEYQEVLLDIVTVLIPLLYFLVSWAMLYGMSSFYSKFKLFEYNTINNEYLCREEVE